MPDALSALLSACAYCGFISLAACPLSDGTPFKRSLPNAAGISLYIASFLFLPAGRLPALAPGPFTGIIFWGCLFAASFLCAPDAARKKQALLHLFPAFIACCAPAVFAYSRGLPGSPLRLDTFTAMPLWDITDPAEKIGLALLCVSFLSAPAAAHRPSSFEGTLHRLSLAALAVVIFFPNMPEELRRLPPALEILAEFSLFSAKVCIIAMVMKKLPPFKYDAPLSFAFALAGGALTTASLLAEICR